MPLGAPDVALLGADRARLDIQRARELVEQFLADARCRGGLLTLVFHPDKLARPDWLALYEWTLDRAVESRRLGHVGRGIDAWWRAREGALLA